MRNVRLGSRGSPLALRQAQIVRDLLEAHHPDTLTVQIETIRTSGDQEAKPQPRRDDSVKRMFVKEIEEALLEARIDLAVHSLKDLPGELPEGLYLGAIPKREDARDALISDSAACSLDQLPEAALVGTSSLRRQVQLRHLRPDLQLRPIRGNVGTRIEKMRKLGFGAIVLAAAGLSRLGLMGQASYVFPIDQMVPAIGQGALGIEIRTDDTTLRDLIHPLNHPPTYHCVEAERSFLRAMGGGCQVPMGAHARRENGGTSFRAFIASPSDGRFIQSLSHGSTEELPELASRAAEYLLSQGARSILAELESNDHA